MALSHIFILDLASLRKLIFLGDSCSVSLFLFFSLKNKYFSSLYLEFRSFVQIFSIFNLKVNCLISVGLLSSILSRKISQRSIATLPHRDLLHLTSSITVSLTLRTGRMTSSTSLSCHELMNRSWLPGHLVVDSFDGGSTHGLRQPSPRACWCLGPACQCPIQ